jgi:hypothetical protein
MYPCILLGNNISRTFGIQQGLSQREGDVCASHSVTFVTDVSPEPLYGLVLFFPRLT